MKNDLYKILAVGLLLFAAITSGCTDNKVSDNNTTIVPEQPTQMNKGFDISINESNTPIITKMNDTINISLGENPSTGYSWNMTASSGLTPVNDTFVQDPAKPDMVGVGGTHIWVFQVTNQTEQYISAIYKRPFENVTGEEEVFNLTVSVVQ